MNNKKKLLVTASTFPRYEGDTEPRFVLDLSKELNKYYEVTVLAPADPKAEDEEILEGIPIIRYHYCPIHRWETLCYPGAIVPRMKEKKIRILLVPLLFIGLWWKLLKILPQFDFVHAHWLIPQGIVQSFFRKPYVVTGHGGDITSLNVPIIKQLKRRCLQKASHVTVVSQALQNDLKKMEIACEKTTILPMGCRTGEFGRHYRIPNYFGQGNKPVVLFVGRLVEVKGVSYLIEAMQEIDAVLIIIGDGPSRAALERQAGELGQDIRFLGAKNHEELKTIYASADVFMVPSVTTASGDKEGFGLVILEAMASGLPVVASDCGGISSIVQDGRNGFLTEEKNSKDIAEKVNLILKNEQLAAAMQEQIQETAARYDYQTIAEQYRQIFDRI